MEGSGADVCVLFALTNIVYHLPNSAWSWMSDEGERGREEDWCAVNQLVCKWDESEGETVWTEESMRRIWNIDWHWDDTTCTLNALWSMLYSFSHLKFLFVLKNTHKPHKHAHSIHVPYIHCALIIWAWLLRFAWRPSVISLGLVPSHPLFSHCPCSGFKILPCNKRIIVPSPNRKCMQKEVLMVSQHASVENQGFFGHILIIPTIFFLQQKYLFCAVMLS